MSDLVTLTQNITWPEYWIGPNFWHSYLVSSNWTKKVNEWVTYGQTERHWSQFITCNIICCKWSVSCCCELTIKWHTVDHAKLGSVAVFNVIASEILTYSWSRVHEAMPTGARLSDYSRVLTIDNVQLAHEGTYTCRVTRQLGQETARNITIAIEGMLCLSYEM